MSQELLASSYRKSGYFGVDELLAELPDFIECDQSHDTVKSKLRNLSNLYAGVVVQAQTI